MCLAHEACVHDAPESFAMAVVGGYFAFVKRQPATGAEIAACIRALRGCPVDAIHDGDGEGKVVPEQSPTV